MSLVVKCLRLDERCVGRVGRPTLGDLHPERESGLDVEATDHSGAARRDRGLQAAVLVLQDELRQVMFTPWPVGCAGRELHVANDQRRRIEDRFAIADDEILNGAEVDLLAEAQQAPPSRRQGGCGHRGHGVNPSSQADPWRA